MNGLKDFFYKNNDIIIVLLILVAAAYLIYDRIGLIMDYPAQAAVSTQTQTVQEAEDSD